MNEYDPTDSFANAYAATTSSMENFTQIRNTMVPIRPEVNFFGYCFCSKLLNEMFFLNKFFQVFNGCFRNSTIDNDDGDDRIESKLISAESSSKFGVRRASRSGQLFINASTVC